MYLQLLDVNLDEGGEQRAYYLSVICTECWQHISAFNDFQQTVFLAQKLHQSSAITSSAEDGFKTIDCIKIESETFHSSGIVDKTTNSRRQFIDPSLMSNDQAAYLEDTSAEDYVQVKNEADAAILNWDQVAYFKQGPTKSKHDKHLKNNTSSSSSKAQTKRSNDFTEMSRQQKMYVGDLAASSAFSINQTLTYPSDEHAVTTNRPERLSVEGEIYEIYEIDSSCSENETSEQQTDIPDLHSTEDYDVFIAKWRAQLECNVCFKTFPKYSILFQHFQAEHPNKRGQLTCCGELLNDRFEIVQHISQHTNINRYSCDKCPKIYKNASSLNRHRTKIHFGGRPPIKCCNCMAQFTRISHLNRHLKNNCRRKDVGTAIDPSQQKVCQKCGKSFSLRKNLFRHMKIVHFKSSLRNKCEFCHKRYISKCDLTRHMAVHTGERLPCPYCPKTFRYSYILSSHLKKDHPEEWQDKIFSCLHCFMKFNHPCLLDCHVNRVHGIEENGTVIGN